MKLSKQQIETLAQVIRKKLLEKYVVPEIKVKELTLLLKKKKELLVKIDKLEEENKKINEKLKKLSNNSHIYSYVRIEDLIHSLKNFNTPSVQTIQNDIILQSMFSTEKDLELFMESMISKYSK